MRGRGRGLGRRPVPAHRRVVRHRRRRRAHARLRGRCSASGSSSAARSRSGSTRSRSRPRRWPVLAVCAVPVVLVGGIGHVTGEVVVAAVFTGVVCSAVAFTLQLWGQRYVEPSRAAVILLFEPVVAGFVGYLVGERLGVAGLRRRGRDLRRDRGRRVALLAAGPRRARRDPRPRPAGHSGYLTERSSGR